MRPVSIFCAMSIIEALGKNVASRAEARPGLA
jgi:hypothetical protein